MNKRGFTLVENLIAVAIFVLLAGAIYQTSTLLIKSVSSYRENTTISSLASQYMEIVHNLPYSKVGTLSGNPHGDLPDMPNATSTVINGANYKIYYVVNYIDDSADGTAKTGNDFASNDYKQVKLYVENVTTAKKYSFVTNITPRGLENLDSGGALRIKVIDAEGNPVSGANVNISNTNLVPNINLNRTTDTSGDWVEVGLPNNVNSYHITATKTGYSTDQTYTTSVSNPDPVKPHSTIVNGQITEISLAIDKLSTLAFKTLDQNCQALDGISLKVDGAKLIGNPNVLKFTHTYSSNASGEINLGSLEWDNYTPTLNSSTYTVYGSAPIQNTNLLPDTNQEYTLLLGPKTTNSLLVIVRDALNNNPVEGVTVEIQNKTKITGGSIWNTVFSETETGQDYDNTSLDVLPNALRLLSYDQGETYVTSGTFTSNVFDTGSASSTFSNIEPQPASQDSETSIRFEVAISNTNTATTTWNFVDPDSVTGTGRYLKYKAYLTTENPQKTPTLTSLNLNYKSGCSSPGQAFFANLNSGSGYDLLVSAAGYNSQTVSNLNISGNQKLEVLLTK